MICVVRGHLLNRRTFIKSPDINLFCCSRHLLILLFARHLPVLMLFADICVLTFFLWSEVLVNKLKVAPFNENSINPSRPTRRWTDAHFCRFLTLLEYSPIGEKFPPTIALLTLYTVQKKELENFQNFFCFESFNAPK